MKHRLKRTLAALAIIASMGSAHLYSARAENPAVALELAPMPEAVTSFAAATLGGSVYVCGGHRGERHHYSSNMVSGSFHRLNLVQGHSWEKLPETTPAQGAPLVAYKHYLYRTGGMAAHNAAGAKQDLWSLTNVIRFNTRSGKWENFAPLPEARSSHDSVVLKDKLYVGGGWDMLGADAKSKWLDTFLVMDLAHPKAGWRSVPQAFKRRALAMAAQDGKIYFIGGMDSDNKPSLAVDVYDPKTEAWSQGPSLPDGKFKGFSCSAINQGGRIYANAFQGDLLRLSTDGKTWEVVGRLQHPRMAHRLITAGKGQVIALGGEDGDDKRRDLEVFTPKATPEVKKQASAILN